MEKAFEIQRQVRDNAKTFHTYLTDLQNWEVEMKRKEAALNGEFEQDLPPVRSKIKKEKPVLAKKKQQQRIPSYDYKSWDKYDVDRACEEVDMEEVGPMSLDGKKSLSAKQEKLREEAQFEKERGNNFVKHEKWDEAIACYNRAIELVKDDAIYFANRGLCYLKKDNLHQAETDCTEALRIDPTYVKAYQRRATAREKLGSLRAASQDLNEVLKLEPHNNAAKKQLLDIRARMGTKGSKSKSSPVTTPTIESKPITTAAKPNVPKIVELPDEPKPVTKVEVKPPNPLEKWRDGVGENITVIKPVKKPPHLRSKRALKHIPIQEILLGRAIVDDKPPTRLKIIEIENSADELENNNNSINGFTKKIDEEDIKNGEITSPESEKLIIDSTIMEKDVKNLVAPVNSVQFMSDWKYLNGKPSAQSDYLNLIHPQKIPTIFANALESDILSELLIVLHDNREKFQDKTIAEYLKAFCKVKRFSALAMFLSSKDKQIVSNLLEHCKTVENCGENEIADLRNKFEL